jgi:hypothetical protein
MLSVDRPEVIAVDESEPLAGDVLDKDDVMDGRRNAADPREGARCAAASDGELKIKTNNVTIGPTECNISNRRQTVVVSVELCFLFVEYSAIRRYVGEAL